VSEAVLLAALEVASKTLDLVILVIKDQPQVERQKAWERWFLWWDPIWKAMGLDPTKGPL